jgi:toxin-antitoxin system PIN domain toxin
MPAFAAARELVRRLAEGEEAWALPWPALHEFVGVVTNPRVFRVPTSTGQALDQVAEWLAAPAVRLLSEDDRFFPAWRQLLTGWTPAGAAIHDAKIAALCLQHGVTELWSADRDFTRFAPLTARNPLR